MLTKNVDVTNRSEIKIPEDHIDTKESVRLGVLLAIVGGFLDAYTFISRGGVFANAQTGNIVLVGVELTKGEWLKALMAFLPILAFVIGVIVAEKIKSFPAPSLNFVIDSERIILILEIIILFIIGFIPSTVPNSIVTITISFVCSVQISSFRKLVDSPYSTAMCTGNLRSATEAAYSVFVNKDKKSLLKLKRFGIIILSFLVGACFSGFLTGYFGVKSIWFAVLVLILAVILFSVDQYRDNKYLE